MQERACACSWCLAPPARRDASPLTKVLPGLWCDPWLPRPFSTSGLLARAVRGVSARPARALLYALTCLETGCARARQVLVLPSSTVSPVARLRGLRPTWLSDPKVWRTEVLGGLVVALALIPEAISFSIIAGVDPALGLFASFTMAVVMSVVGGRMGDDLSGDRGRRPGDRAAEP